MQTKKIALIVGGNGIVGRNMAKYLQARDIWDEVIITSYREPDFETTAKFVHMDLTDAQAVENNAAALAGVSHVFYAAYMEKQTLAEQTATNILLLQNLVLGLEKVASGFKHLTFIQGGKAYGAHLGKYKTPALETDSRHFPPNFYYSQQDFLIKQSAGKAWSWTAVRPDIMVGFAVGNPMNMANLIAVYETLCNELNVPFRFPGSDMAYKVLVNITDSEILAKGMEYAALHEDCYSQIYNVTNGDIFRWEQIWPKIAAYFNVNMDSPITFPLAEYMADKEEVWAGIVEKYGLKPHTVKELANWPFGDFIFNVEADAFFDVNKFRRAGFHEMQVESFESFKNTFDELKAQNIIPA
ncbi:Nucleoside-diphosphate-sugar epimerase [Mucilaginibacter gossypiicola]|uniref:Nucleoside-diphosphate-sugar epimerase n=1 Tax=Mucilaginibacter gossypiicola TaxID=551995 RepID=A0A1H8LMC7_9SPHI|nr:SDR family oxidoreductase [Mucilaginibacter gossypiicola]SEO05938.1 Nucleoside-diphosphate-sugar epimerase [Mucilaginibacter gossypiicola]